jgi:hypothetical protein
MTTGTEKPTVITVEPLTLEPVDGPAPSTFRSRARARDARIAAGEAVDVPRRTFGIDAGIDSVQPTITVSHVRA